MYKKKVSIDGIYKFIICYVCCLVNQFLICLGSPHFGQQKLCLVPTGCGISPLYIPEGTDPQLSHLLYVTLLGIMFGADCQFILSACSVFTTELLLSLM